MLAAYANLQRFGQVGLRVLLGHLVEMAESLREHPEGHDCMTILNDDGVGPVTVFRVYPDGVDTWTVNDCERTDPGARQALDAVAARVRAGDDARDAALSWCFEIAFARIYDAGCAMRTTLTLDDDVAALLRQRATTLGVSFKEMVNQALRAGIAREMAPRDVVAPKTIPHSFGVRAGVDPDKLNQLADELEAEAAAESLKRIR